MIDPKNKTGRTIPKLAKSHPEHHQNKITYQGMYMQQETYVYTSSFCQIVTTEKSDPKSVFVDITACLIINHSGPEYDVLAFSINENVTRRCILNDVMLFRTR